MKELFKKPWFIGLLTLGSLLLVFFLNLWIMSIELLPPVGEDFWFLSGELDSGEMVNIFAFAFTLLFYISIVLVLLPGISILKKNNAFFVATIIYFICYETLLIVFHSLFSLLSVFAIVLVILNILLSMGALVLLMFRRKAINQMIGAEPGIEVNLSRSKLPLGILIVDIIAVALVILTFVIPVYSVVISNTIVDEILISVLISGDDSIGIVIYFLANFIFFLGILIFFAQCLSYFFYSKTYFVKRSKTLVFFVFVNTFSFFIGGLTMVVYRSILGDTAQTIAYIPMLLVSVVIFVLSIFIGKFHALNHTEIKEPAVKFARIESLIYVVLLSAINGLMLLLKIIKIRVESGPYSDLIELTGIAILRDYANLDPGYRAIAFILVIMLISSGLALIASISSYLGKYRRFDSIVKSATAINLFFVFMISISGYYFQIAQQIDHAVIVDVFEYYGINIPGYLDDYEYVIRPDAIYALIAAVVVLVLMFLRKAFDRDELIGLSTALSPTGFNPPTPTASPSANSVDDEIPNHFDPCPAFTELDHKSDQFQQDLKRRITSRTKNTTLSDLVHFVVEYARNSRLHLSYTEEDIATFVAGLGASKLSILQGMSGTGKTSLPKIFSEAIFGNCEIVEVESSWKDKNELLGYYNEFSMKYTPKKFTLALYKTALNQDIFTIILLDEMNLSRIEYYFSDFLSLMENEEEQRELKLLNIKLSRRAEGKTIEYLALDQGHTLKIPPNVWFIGTANRDESTFVISDKVYDRAQTMNFTKRAAKVRNYSNPIPPQYYDYRTLNRLFIDAKQNGSFDAENSDLIKSVEALLAPYNISFGNRILKQIEDFVNVYKACFANDDVESEAIEKILLSKVVAKLEVKTIDDKEKLEMEFEKLNCHECVAFIKRLDSE